MFKAEFELEAITPIFMRGADQTKAEIRSSSIKGLMRWWFRALAGNYFGDNVDKLRETEEEIFGSTKRRSGVVVELTLHQINFSYYPLPMVWNKNAGNRLRRYAIAPRSSFGINIRSNDSTYLRVASCSLLALSHFGGLGFRSNRGAGSVRIKNYESDVEIPKLPKHKSDIPTFIDELIATVSESLHKLGYSAVCSSNSCLAYPSFKCFYYFLWKSSNNIDGIYYKANNLEEDGNLTILDEFEKNFKDVSMHGSKYGYMDFIFGLPRKGRKDRRASTMKVGVLKINGSYRLRISVFKTSVFKPDIGIRNWDCIFKFLDKINAEKIYPKG